MSLSEAAASVAARAFFYPSLAWNIARSRIQETWHWWDEITENIILGALPFHSTLDELKSLGVTAVVTLNEEFEVFITSEQYQGCGFDHLHIPTVDFLYAPSLEDLHKGTDFIQSQADAGGKTYVHCKAGRGRSTTLVLCFLIKYLAKTPEEAYKFVRSKRHQVYLAQNQWTAVCEFYLCCHTDLGLTVDDFPYPTFLSSDIEESGSESESQLLQDGAVTAAPSAAIDLSLTNLGTPAARRQIKPSEVSEAPQASPKSSVSSQADTNSPDCSLGSSPAVQISASAQAANKDVASCQEPAPDFVGGEGSLANLSTAFATCHLKSKRGAADAKCNEQSATAPSMENPHSSTLLPDFAGEVPERAASPAIEIPRTNHEDASGSESFENATYSSGSISLEPSGSLPGYVRIAPIPPRTSSSPSSNPSLRWSGFTVIDKWGSWREKKPTSES